MNKKVGILTSPDSWFAPYAKMLRSFINWLGFDTKLYKDHEEVKEGLYILFILGYYKKVSRSVLDMNEYNLVVHESDLPKGKGWSPLFWQILEGKNKIPIVLFEASEDIDSGQIYLKDYILLSGYELRDEIREKQAYKTMELCIKFLMNHKKLVPVPQKGEETFYKKMTMNQHKLDVDKTIREQFNILRISDNKRFPAFFELDGYLYKLEIYRMK